MIINLYLQLSGRIAASLLNVGLGPGLLLRGIFATVDSPGSGDLAAHQAGSPQRCNGFYSFLVFILVSFLFLVFSCGQAAQ